MNLTGKHILVTGASSGIGSAIAVACAERGATVLVNYRNNRKGADQTLREVNKRANGFLFQADLTNVDEIEKMFREIRERVGAIDIVVNNAGEAQPGDFFNDAIWKDQFDSIFFSALHVSQLFLRQAPDAPLRKILNITSSYGNLNGGNTEYFAYSVAKAALASLTVTLAKANNNVLVNGIAPGYTWTPAWEGISDEEKRLCESRTTINRFITPDEIAHTAVAILENNAITGQIITVDGGLSLQSIERATKQQGIDRPF